MTILNRSIITLTLLCFLTVQITFFATPSQATSHPEECAYTTLISGDKKSYLGNVHLAPDDVGLSCYNENHEIISTSKFFDGSDVGLDGVNITGIDLTHDGDLLFSVDQDLTLYNPTTHSHHQVTPNHILRFTFTPDSTVDDTKGHIRIVATVPLNYTIIALSHVYWNEINAFQVIVQDPHGVKHLLSQPVVNGSTNPGGWTMGPDFSQSPVFQNLNNLDVSTLMLRDLKVIPMVTLIDLADAPCQEEPAGELVTTRDFIDHIDTLDPICRDALEVQGLIGAEAMFVLGLPAYLPASSEERLDGRGTLLAHSSTSFYTAMGMVGMGLVIGGLVLSSLFLCFAMPLWIKAVLMAFCAGFVIVGTVLVVISAINLKAEDEETAINNSAFPKLTKKIMSLNPVDLFVDDKTTPIQTSAFALIFSESVKERILYGG